MLDMGFEPQIRRIVQQVTQHREIAALYLLCAGQHAGVRAAADDDVLRHLPEGDPEPGGGLPQGLRVPRRGQGRLHLGEHHPEDRLGRGGGEGNLFFLNC